MLTLQSAINQDLIDPLSPLIEEFDIDNLKRDISRIPGVTFDFIKNSDRLKEIYLDGNSLWAPCKQWIINELKFMLTFAHDKIKWWEKRVDLPNTVGDSIWEKFLWAKKWETVMCDNVSNNLFKLISSLVKQWKNKLYTHSWNFPTDKYILDWISDFANKLWGDVESLQFDENIEDGVTASDIKKVIKENNWSLEWCVFLVSHVDYKTSALTDMKEINKLIESKWWVLVWDFSHSLWAVDIDVKDMWLKYAAWATYKYGNGWPWSMWFLFVDEDVLENTDVIIQSRWGQDNATQFKFKNEFNPSSTAERFITWTPNIAWYQYIMWYMETLDKCWITMTDLRKRSSSLNDYTLQLVEQKLSWYWFDSVTSINSQKRWWHVSFNHEFWMQIAASLRNKNVIPDFRPTVQDSYEWIIRVAPVASYTTYADIYNAIDRLELIMKNKEYTSVNLNAKVV